MRKLSVFLYVVHCCCKDMGDDDAIKLNISWLHVYVPSLIIFNDSNITILPVQFNCVCFLSVQFDVHCFN